MGISFKKFACLQSLVERRFGSKLFYRTAPEGVLCYKDGLPRLLRTNGCDSGGVRQACKNSCCGFLKRDPHAPVIYQYFLVLNCYKISIYA